MLYSTLPLFSLQPETKEMHLPCGHVVIVDAADYEWLSQWKWHALNNHGRGRYAIRGEKAEDGKQVTVYMHRLIMSAGKGILVDHINGDGLDNRRINLRLATRHENMRNQHNQRSNSGYRGVSWHRTRKKWGARIRYANKLWHLGWFDDPKEAALAYNKAALEYFGEFASPNKVEE